MSARLERLGDLSRRLSRNHTRREIPWDAFDPSTHSAAARTRVGKGWAWRAKQEHLAVGAFSHVTRSLCALGCDPSVLGLMARAASDEVRHAALCAEWARRLLEDPGVAAERFRGTPTLPTYGDADLATRTLAEVVEMCCFSETLTGVYFTEMLARATHPTAKALVESLLEDEIDHGRVGWAYLAQRRADGSLEGLEPHLAAIADRTVGQVLREANARPEASDPDVEQLGHLALDTAAALYLDALEDVVVPGLESAEVDASSVRAKLAGWRGELKASAP